MIEVDFHPAESDWPGQTLPYRLERSGRCLRELQKTNNKAKNILGFPKARHPPAHAGSAVTQASLVIIISACLFTHTDESSSCGWLTKTPFVISIGGLLTLHTDMIHVAFQELKLLFFNLGKKMSNNDLIWVLLTLCFYSEGHANKHKTQPRFGGK